MQRQQAKQAKKLQAAEKQHKKDKADLRDTIRLTPDAKLTGAQKRRLTASIQKAKRDGKIPHTAQETIPYQEMCRDGICIVTERYFTKQVQFYDINYQLGATRSRTNTTPQRTKLCGRLDHVVLKTGDPLKCQKVTTYIPKSGMMG